MKPLFLSLFLLFFQANFSQNNEKALNKMSYDELKEAFFENENDLKLQKRYSQEFLKKAKTEKLPNKIARGYYYYSLTIEKPEISIKYLDSIINILKNKKDFDSDFPIVAYYQKGILNEKMFNYEEAINNYLIVEKMAIQDNNFEYYFDCKYSIGKIKSEYLEEVEEALNLFKQCEEYFKGKDVRNSYYNDSYQKTLFAIADTYKSLNELDSASFYNQKGFDESVATKNNKMKYLFSLNEGAVQIAKKNYQIGLDSINSVYPNLLLEKKIGNNILASYYYYGKAYEGLKKYKEAILNYKKVDSIYQQNKLITPEFVGGYTFLIDYYKKIGDTKNELKYINIYLEIEKTFHQNYKNLLKKINSDFDTPNLLREKETLINSLENNNTSKKYTIIGLLFFTFLLFYFGVNQYLQRKKDKKKFETLFHQTSKEPENSIDIGKIKTTKKLEIAPAIIENILQQLNKFEKEKGFLQNSITINTLAQDFETNTKYLSEIINHYKESSFTNYLNNLRIDFAVEELKKNKKWQKYSIYSIATEVGFNTSESFSSAFFKKNGIKPSYFMKELQKIKY